MNQSLVVDISANISRFQADMQRGASVLEQFGQKAAQVGTALSLSISAPLGLLAKKTIDAYGEMDSLTRGLATLEKSSVTLKARLSELQEVAKLPGLGYKEAIQFDISLRSAGFSADLSKRSMMAFGNALGSIGKGKNELRGVSLQLQQLAGKTSGFGADIRVIKEYAPQVGAALQAAFGTIDTEKIAKMGVTGKQVVEKIVNELDKLPKATGGIKNAFENLQDSTFRSMAKLGESLSKSLNIEGFVNTLGTTISSLVDGFSTLSTPLKTIIAGFGLALVIVPPLLALLGFMASTVLPALAAGFALLTGPIGIAIAVIAAAATLIVMHWDKVKSALVDSGAWNVMRELAKNTVGVIVSIFGVFANLFQGDWHNLWESAWNIFKYAWNGIVSFLIADVAIIGGVIGKLAEIMGMDKVAAKIKAGTASIKAAISGLKADVPSLRGAVGDLFGGLNFRGKDAVGGKPASGGGKPGKAASAPESYLTQLQHRLSELETTIKEFGAKGLEIPDYIIKEYSTLADKIKLADEALKDLQKTELSGVNAIANKNAVYGTQGVVNQGERTGKFNKSLNGGGVVDAPKLPGWDAFAEKLKSVAKTTKTFAQETTDNLSQLGKDITASLQNAAQAGLVGMGELIGGLLSGTASLSQLPKMIGGIFADLAKSMGQAMIAFGTAGLAAKAFVSNPISAIVAGVALVALGAAMQGMMTQKSGAAFSRPMANGGILSGPQHIYAGEYAGAASNPEVVAPLNKLKGMLGDVGGSGGTLTTRIAGSDLLLILERAGKSRKAYGNG